MLRQIFIIDRQVKIVKAIRRWSGAGKDGVSSAVNNGNVGLFKMFQQRMKI